MAGNLRKVASGQRIIIAAVVLNLLLVIFLPVAGKHVGMVAAIGIVAVTFVGIFRLSSGMQYAVGWRILLALLVLIPVVSLITLAILNARATKTLRGGGYRVGFFGASRHATTA